MLYVRVDNGNKVFIGRGQVKTNFPLTLGVKSAKAAQTRKEYYESLGYYAYIIEANDNKAASNIAYEDDCYIYGYCTETEYYLTGRKG